MNKFQLYRQIREELAAHYEKELRTVTAVLEEGVEAIASSNTRLACSPADSLVTNGDAHKVFREELTESMRFILERYQRSLRKEIETLGIKFDTENWKKQSNDIPASFSGVGSLRSGNGAEPH